MTVLINGKTYYRTAEVFRLLGISRNTLYRWLHKDTRKSTELRDSRGWRLFTQKDIDELNHEFNYVTKIRHKAPREIKYVRKSA